jgi:hypothetical protein
MTSASSAASTRMPDRTNQPNNSILERNGGKELMMGLIQAENSAVREQALLAIQKMMIHNWQTLA